MGGIFKGGGVPQQTNKPAITEMQQDVAAMQPKSQSASAAQPSSAEDKAARRRARRGGRAMLSDSRLNPEQGIATLGQTGL